MKKISLTAICPASARIFGISALTFLCAFNAFAKNNCDTNASLINPAMLAQSGIGGTGATQSGIGGTGLHDGGMGGTGNPEGGIGGTGHIANDGGIGGTGIVGTITGFASICVNGIEIHYAANTTVSVDGRLSTVRELAVGQIVAARASGSGHELTARNIAVIHATVGPVSNFNSEKGEMQVLDQAIRIEQSGDRGNFSNLKTGDWVQVSGHRLTNGTIVASRVETIPPRAEARLNGHITQIDEQGFEVNGTRIQHDAKSLPQGLAKGMEVSIAGHWDGAHLKAQQIQTEPTRQSIGNVDHVVIEGYIHALDGKELNLSNRIVTLDTNAQITGNARNDLRLDQRIQISGRPGADQRINPDRIELKQEIPVQLQIQERIDKGEINTDERDRKSNSGSSPEAKSIQGDKGDQNQSSGSGSDHKGESKKDADSNSGKNHSSGGDSHAKDTAIPASGDPKTDHSGSSGSGHGEKPLDTREQNLSDQKPIDKPEKPLELDSSERSTDHRESIRNIDVPDRVRDHSGHHDRDFSHRDRDFDR